MHTAHRFGCDERIGLTALAARAYELTGFLATVVHFVSMSKTSIKTITYHDSCSGLRELGVKQPPRAVLAGVEGAQLREMSECEQRCGFDSASALKCGEISPHIAERKCENITASGADAVVLGDLGCMLNIEGRLRRRGDQKTQLLHVAEVLAGKTAG
jgi:L-lactate dehydrogenase complex protein LldE